VPTTENPISKRKFIKRYILEIQYIN